MMRCVNHRRPQMTITVIRQRTIRVIKDWKAAIKIQPRRERLFHKGKPVKGSVRMVSVRGVPMMRLSVPTYTTNPRRLIFTSSYEYLGVKFKTKAKADKFASVLLRLPCHQEPSEIFNVWKALIHQKHYVVDFLIRREHEEIDEEYDNNVRPERCALPTLCHVMVGRVCMTSLSVVHSADNPNARAQSITYHYLGYKFTSLRKAYKFAKILETIPLRGHFASGVWEAMQIQARVAHNILFQEICTSHNTTCTNIAAWRDSTDPPILTP